MLVVPAIRLGLLIALAAVAAGQFGALLPHEDTRDGTCTSTACRVFVPGGGLSFR